MEVILAWTLAELISPLAELISRLAELISLLAELIPALAELIPAAWDVCSIPLCRAGALSGLGASGLDSAVDHLRTVLSSTRVGGHVSLAILCRHALFVSGSNSYHICPTHPALFCTWVGGAVL